MKTLKYTFFILFNLFYLSLFSQHIEPLWIKHFGTPSGKAYINNYKSFYEDSDGNIILSIYLKDIYVDSNFINGDYALKLTPSGDYIVIKKLEEIGLRSFSIDNENNIIYVKTVHSENFTDVFTLIKLDSNFDSLWVLNFLSEWNLFFEGTGVKNIRIDSQNNIYLPFTPNDVSTVLPNNDTVFSNEFFVKINAEGEFIKSYVLPDLYYAYCFDLIEKDSLFYFTYGQNIVEYDTTPQVKQMRSFYKDLFHFSIDSNHFYLSDWGADTLYNFVTNDTIINNNLFIHKLNNSFDDVWIKKVKGYMDCLHPTIQNLYLCRSSFKCIKTEVSNNALFVYGAFKYKLSISNDTFFTQDSSKYSFFIMKFDKNGNYHWTEVFQSLEPNIDDLSNTFELKVMSDNSLLCGIVFTTQIQIYDSLYIKKGNNDLILMRLHETGTGLKPLAENKSFSFELYPNPANDVVTIDILSDENIGSYTFKIFDLMGTLVYSKAVSIETNHYSDKFNISHLPQGMYFVTLEAQNGKIVKKLVKF